MRTLLLILSPVYLMLLLPFIWLVESVKVLGDLILEYIKFLRYYYISYIKELINFGKR